MRAPAHPRRRFRTVEALGTNARPLAQRTARPRLAEAREAGSLSRVRSEAVDGEMSMREFLQQVFEGEYLGAIDTLHDTAGVTEDYALIAVLLAIASELQNVN